MSEQTKLDKSFKANGFIYTLHYLDKKSWKNKDGNTGETWCYTPYKPIRVRSSFDVGIPVASLEYKLKDSQQVDGLVVSSFPIWLEKMTDSIAEQQALKGLDKIYIRSSNDENMPVSLLTIEEAISERNTEELVFSPQPSQPQDTQTEQVTA
tara:strand:- start:177 stop:632 length:456 start_codon:yes stop_codon:yes gene_type:complete